MTTVVLILSVCAVAAVTAWIASTWLRSVITSSVDSLKKKNVETVSPVAVQNRRLTMNDVEMCVRKEGYIPYYTEDGPLEFKHESEIVSVFYEDQKSVFLIRKTYGLSPEQVQMTDLIEKVCSKVQDHIMSIRNYLHVFPDNQIVVVFEIGFFIDSADDMEKYFSKYMDIIKDSVECHRYFLNEYTQGMPENVESQEHRAQVQNDKKVLS